MAQAHLFACLDGIVDPRHDRGIRHPASAVLKLTVLGLCCRLVSMRQINVFAHEYFGRLKNSLGFTRDTPPHATTIGRLLEQIDCCDLQEAFERWVAELVGTAPLIAAVDEKAACNAKESDRVLMAVNVFAHEVKQCLAQWPVAEKEGEPTVLADRLRPLFERYPGLRLLTGDAYSAGRDLCAAITTLGRHYLVQIKGDQPSIKQALEEWFGEEKERNPDASSVSKKGVWSLPVSFGLAAMPSPGTCVSA